MGGTRAENDDYLLTYYKHQDICQTIRKFDIETDIVATL